MVTVGIDDLIVAWGGALLFVLCVGGISCAVSRVGRVFITGVLADFFEPSFEALLCLLAEGELTRLVVSVSVSDCELRRDVEDMGFDMTVSLWARSMKGVPPTASQPSDGKTYVPRVRAVVPFLCG